jgi:hypothetical protein
VAFVLYSPDHGSKALPEQTAFTASFMGRLVNCLFILYALTLPKTAATSAHARKEVQCE